MTALSAKVILGCTVQNPQRSKHVEKRGVFPALQALRCQVLDPDLEPGAASHLACY